MHKQKNELFLISTKKRTQKMTISHRQNPVFCVETRQGMLAMREVTESGNVLDLYELTEAL
jgi:hypothetical protein